MQLFVWWENRFLPTDTEHVFFSPASRTLMVKSMIWLPTLNKSSLLTAPFLRSAVLSWIWLRCTFQVSIVFLFKPTLDYHSHHLVGSKWNIVDCASCGTFAALPREILMYIFRWVVSSDLDLRALEQLSLVCRGFYICARSAPPLCESRSLLCAYLVILRSYISRDPEIWHSACARVWGRNCTKVVPFKSWRDMFLRRPRVRFDGKRIF